MVSSSNICRENIIELMINDLDAVPAQLLLLGHDSIIHDISSKDIL